MRHHRGGHLQGGHVGILAMGVDVKAVAAVRVLPVTNVAVTVVGVLPEAVVVVEIDVEVGGRVVVDVSVGWGTMLRRQ
jgi:hypothetical protein